MNYYKATRPDGTDFHTGTIDYARALETGEVIRHPAKMIRDDPRTYLSVSVHPANCSGMGWPCRLFRVEPVGRTLKAQFSESKRSCSALRVVEELPAHMALGPQGEEVAALIERCRSLTTEEGRRLDAAWSACDAARGVARNAAWAARDAACDAAWNAAWNAAGNAAGNAARNAAWAAAWDAQLMAQIQGICADLEIPEPHRQHVAARWEVWQMGYSLFCDVNGVLYVYKKVV